VECYFFDLCGAACTDKDPVELGINPSTTALIRWGRSSQLRGPKDRISTRYETLCHYCDRTFKARMSTKYNDDRKKFRKSARKGDKEAVGQAYGLDNAFARNPGVLDHWVGGSRCLTDTSGGLGAPGRA
jgi:hypothetical protein